MANGVPPGPAGLVDLIGRRGLSSQTFMSSSVPGPVGLDSVHYVHSTQSAHQEMLLGHAPELPSQAETAQPVIDVAAAIQKIKSIAQPNYTGKCAMHVRMALEAGGADMRTRPVYARDYGPKLLELGFSIVAPQGYTPQSGDVVVFQDYPGQRVPAGHIQMFDGGRWVSDTVQNNFLANQQHYRDISYAIYRP